MKKFNIGKWHKCIDEHGWPCFSSQKAAYLCISDFRMLYNDLFLLLAIEELVFGRYFKILLNERILFIYVGVALLHTDKLIEIS